MPCHETNFEDDNTEAVFLVNASDVYNALNHQAALTNAHTLAMPHPCADTYQHVPGNTKLYVQWRGVHLVSRGTTQGVPLAMVMYAIGTLPLIHQLHFCCSSIIKRKHYRHFPQAV